jgi:hypothetical protein
MKKKLLIIGILSIIITNTVFSQEKLSTKPNYAVFSWANISNNPEKASIGYLGYWAGIGTHLTVFFGLAPSFWLPHILTAPISGSLGASLGVYLAGDIQNQSSRLDQTLYGGLKGGLLGLWNWILPIPFVNPLINPLSPTLHAVDKYNKHAYVQTNKKELKSTISTSPIHTIWGMGRLFGHSKTVDTPIIIAFETNLRPLKTLYLEGIAQNQMITKEKQETLRGYYSNASWRRKYYGLTIGSRSYRRHTLSGWFHGYGATLFYSSLSEGENIEEWTMYSGNGYFIKPHVELGYHLNLTRHFYILGGFRLGPTVSLSTYGEHYKVLQEKHRSVINGITGSIIIRSGWSW